jgi:hypothetical protein
MGWLSHVVAYKFGKNRGRKKAERNFARTIEAGPHPDVFQMSDECVNYESFCRNFGSCDGMECEYDA